MSNTRHELTPHFERCEMRAGFAVWQKSKDKDTQTHTHTRAHTHTYTHTYKHLIEATHIHRIHRSHTNSVRQIYTQEVPPTPLPLVSVCVCVCVCVSLSLSLSLSLSVTHGSVLLSSSQSCFSPRRAHTLSLSLTLSTLSGLGRQTRPLLSCSSYSLPVCLYFLTPSPLHPPPLTLSVSFSLFSFFFGLFFNFLPPSTPCATGHRWGVPVRGHMHVCKWVCVCVCVC